MNAPDVYVPEKGRFSGMVPVDETKCRKRVWNGAPSWYSSQCSRKKVVEEDGYGWCKQHAPSTVKAKADAQKAEWNRRSRESKYRSKTERLEREIVTRALAWNADSLATDETEDALQAACSALKSHLESEP